MKQYVLFFSLLLCAGIATAQPVIFSRCYGGSGNEERCYSTMDAPPGVIMTGRANSNTGDVVGLHGTIDGWVVRTNAIGAISWAKCYGGGDDEALMKTIRTADNNLLHVGYSSAPGGDVTYNYGSTDYWVIKTDTLGTILWQKSYGGSAVDCAYSALDFNDGTYIIGGVSCSNDGMVTAHHGNATTRDVWLIKISAADGHLIWERSIGGSGNESQVSSYRFFRLMSMIAYDDSTLAFTIGTNSLDGDVTDLPSSTDFWLVKADTSGAIIFDKTFGGSAIDMAYNLVKTLDGGFIMAGASLSNDGDVTGHHGAAIGMYDYWVAKTDSAGVLQWQRSCGGTAYEDAFGLCATSLGYYVIGRSESVTNDLAGNGQHGNSDYWVAFLDYNGILQWGKCLGGNGFDEGTEVLVTSDGYLTCAGHAGSNDGDVMSQHGGFDFWLVKLFDVNSINDHTADQEELNVYPNPGTDRVTFSGLGADAQVQVYNAQGQLVKMGNTEGLSLDCSDLPVGIYEFVLLSEAAVPSRARWIKASAK